MKLYTNIFTTIAVTIASIFGFVPQDKLFILQNQVNNLESKIDSQKTASETLLGAYNITGGGTYRLKSAATSIDTTLNLSSFKEPVSNIPYTMSYINTSIGYGTLDPQSSRSEFVSFSGITQNSDGSAQLTGVTRGLTRTPAGSDCTASTTLAQRHPGQAIFILSDSPCHFTEYTVKDNDETVTGYWTLPEPISNSNPATKNYVDTHVNGGTVSNAQVVVAGTAGETVSAGQILYLKQSDGRWYKAGTTIAEASSSPLGIAEGAGTSGNPITTGVLISGQDSNQSGLTVGANYFLTSTSGTIGTATTTRYVGKARTTTSFYFNTSAMSEIFTRSANTASTTVKIAAQNIQVIGTTTLDIIAPSTDKATTTMATTTINGLVPWGLIAKVNATTTSKMTAVFPARENIHIQIFASTTDNGGTYLRFNGDNGNSYYVRGTTGSVASGVATTSIYINNQVLAFSEFYDLSIFNNTNMNKLINIDYVAHNDGASLVATSTGAVWKNATTSITSIDVIPYTASGSGNTLRTTSYIKVYGDTANPL